MTRLQTRQYEMLVRVQQFGQAHPEERTSSRLAAGGFDAVEAAVRELSAQAASPPAVTRETTEALVASRKALLGHLDAMIRTARLVAEQAPERVGVFRRPKRVSDEALLTMGRAFAHDALALRDAFVERGLPPTFIEDLSDALASFERALGQREASRIAHAARRSAVAAALRSGIDAARTLDVIVANQHAGDSDTLAHWAESRRVAPPKAGKRTDLTPEALSLEAPAPEAPPPSVEPTAPLDASAIRRVA